MSNPHILIPLFGLVFSLLPDALVAQTPGTTGDQQILDAWGSASGASGKLVADSDGGSRLEWHAGVTANVYDKSSSGGQILTPHRDGDFYSTTTDFSVGHIAAAGARTQFLTSLAHSNDAAVLTHPVRLNLLQLSRSGQDFEVSLGNINAVYSDLGTMLPFYGVSLSRSFGATTIAVSGGVLDDSWESLRHAVPRQQYKRELWATKLTRRVGQGLQLYTTFQGFRELADSISAPLAVYAPTSGRNATVGFGWQQGPYALQAELARSHWEPQGFERRKDSARNLSGSWSGDKVAVRGGHYRIGTYYSSLSGQSVPGMEESYLGLDWRARDWLTINTEARQMINDNAYDATLHRADTLSSNAAFDLRGLYPGWSAGLQLSATNGENRDGSKNDMRLAGISTGYTGPEWGSTVSYTRTQLENALAPSLDNTSSIWSGRITKSWGAAVQAVSGWSGNAALSLSHKIDRLVYGPEVVTKNAAVDLSVLRDKFISIVASSGYTVTQRADLVRDVVTRRNLLETVWYLKDKNSLKLYLQANRNSGPDFATFKDRIAGVQFVYAH